MWRAPRARLAEEDARFWRVLSGVVPVVALPVWAALQPPLPEPPALTVVPERLVRVVLPRSPASGAPESPAPRSSGGPSQQPGGAAAPGGDPGGRAAPLFGPRAPVATPAVATEEALALALGQLDPAHLPGEAAPQARTGHGSVGTPLEDVGIGDPPLSGALSEEVVVATVTHQRPEARRARASLLASLAPPPPRVPSAALHDFVKVWRRDFDRCVSTTRRAWPSAEGRFVLTFALEDGRATRVDVEGSSLAAAELRRCFQRMSKRWTAPIGVAGEASVPVLLSR